MRCLGLGRSIIVALLRSWHLILPKDHTHTAKIARINLASHPAHRHGALYGAAFPFRAKQSNVFILPVCSFQGASKGRKNPLTYKPKKRPLLQPILKILCNFFFEMVVRIKSPSLISRTKRVLYTGFCKISDSL